jgi:hypothetical protein
LQCSEYFILCNYYAFKLVLCYWWRLTLDNYTLKIQSPWRQLIFKPFVLYAIWMDSVFRFPFKGNDSYYSTQKIHDCVVTTANRIKDDKQMGCKNYHVNEELCGYIRVSNINHKVWEYARLILMWQVKVLCKQKKKPTGCIRIKCHTLLKKKKKDLNNSQVMTLHTKSLKKKKKPHNFLSHQVTSEYTKFHEPQFQLWNW